MLGLDSYVLYVQDYGGPVGLRLAMRHPERVQAIVAQNIGLYEEGLTHSTWDEMKSAWADPSPVSRERLRPMLRYEYTRYQWVHGVPDPEALPPETYTLDDALLQRPGWRRSSSIC